MLMRKNKHKQSAMLRWLILTWSVLCAMPFRIAVAGAHGRLGRELVYQSLARRWDVTGITRRPLDPLPAPVRRGFFAEDTRMWSPMRAENLELISFHQNMTYDALIVCFSGRPFEEDDSDVRVANLCANLPQSCQKVCLMSAFGVGDSLPANNLGIRAMESWYLRDVYASKRRQEALVSSLPSSVQVLVVRSRALSIVPVLSSPVSISRRDMAREILEWVAS